MFAYYYRLLFWLFFFLNKNFFVDYFLIIIESEL